MIQFNSQEFNYLQQYINEMYQSSMLRDGPSGNIINTIRSKFLIIGPVDLTNVEQRFMLQALQDTFQTSHSPIVASQYGTTMKVLGESNRQVQSSINQSPSQLSGTYLMQWEVIQNCMTKLGIVPPPHYKPIEVGPDGDLGGIATPTHHDINDGTGYNHR